MTRIVFNPVADEGLQLLNEDGAPGAGLNPLGEYNNSTNYTVGDSISYLGSSYVMYVDAAAGTLPTDTTKWQVLALKGSDGVGTDELVKLSALDPTAGYLDAKLQEGVQAVQFDVTNTPLTSSPGLIQWNTVDGTYDMGLLNSSVLQVGQETMFYGKASGAIANGDLCQFAGVEGDHILIKKAVGSEIEANPHFLVGVATEPISNGNFGYVTWFGKINGVYTDTPANQDNADWVAGDILYFNVSTGQLTKTMPTAPDRVIIVAAVIKVQTGAAENGIILVRPSFGQKLQELDDVNGTPLTENGQILVWNNDNSYFDFTSNIEDFKTYSGFVNRTDSTIAIDGSGVFTLAPAVTSFDVYTNGTGKHVISASDTVTVTDDQTITYIYIDNTGDLKKSTSPWDLASGANAPCAIVFKDGSTYRLTDERHSYERNKSWHKWAHFNIGAMYYSGLTGVFDSSSLSVGQGVIYDEDIQFDTLATKTTTSLWYRNSTDGMRVISGSTTPFYAPAGVLKYDDGSGTLADVTNNRYTTQWIYASNDPSEPIYTVIGQNNDVTVATARNASRPVINLSTAEWKLIYRVIIRNASGTPIYIESADFRNVQTGVASSGGSVTDHASLTGRDAANSHPISAITDLQTTLDGKADLSGDTFTGGISVKPATNSDAILVKDESDNTIFRLSNATASSLTGGRGWVQAINPTSDAAGSGISFTTNIGTPKTGLFQLDSGGNMVFRNRANASASLYFDANTDSIFRSGTGSAVTAAAIRANGDFDLGHASDTTISRVSAGVVAIEGKNIITTDGAAFTGNISVGNETTGANSTTTAGLGAEMIPSFDAGNWTATNGWAANGTTIVRTTNGTAGTITPSGTFTVVAGRTYKVVIVCSAQAVAAVTYTLGSVTGTTITATTITNYITAYSTNKLIITGAVNSTCTITSISVKEQSETTGIKSQYGKVLLSGEIKNPNGLGGISIEPSGTTRVRGNLGIFGSIAMAGNITGLTNLSMAGTISGATTIGSSGINTNSIASLTTTPSDSYIAQCVTAALVGTPVRISPSIVLAGTSWNTTPTAASKVNAMQQYLLPTTGTTTASSWVWANKTVDGTADTTKLLSLQSNGVLLPFQAPTASAPAYVKGGIYFDTTLSKLRVGGASGWETVTSV